VKKIAQRLTESPNGLPNCQKAYRIAQRLTKSLKIIPKPSFPNLIQDLFCEIAVFKTFCPEIKKSPKCRKLAQSGHSGRFAPHSSVFCCWPNLAIVCNFVERNECLYTNFFNGKPPSIDFFAGREISVPPLLFYSGAGIGNQ
jgi:hypothetical protein